MSLHTLTHYPRLARFPLTLALGAALLVLGCATREKPETLSTEEQPLLNCQYIPTDVTPVAHSMVGGPVIPHVRIHSIYWRDATRFNAYRDDFYRSIVDSPYLEWLSEYTPPQSTTQPSQVGMTIGRGSFIDSFVDHDAPSPVATDAGSQTITDEMIQNELKRLLRANPFNVEMPPYPTFQNYHFTNDLFLIHTPPTVAVKLGNQGYMCPEARATPPGSLVGGYHMGMLFDVPSFGGNALIWYAVLPDCGCGQDVATNCTLSVQSQEDYLTLVASHEIAEAITDANVNAWDSPEIGDKCASASQATVNGYLVQMLWSNNSRSCIATACGCYDFRNDPANCGACNHVCPNNLGCRNSQCGCHAPNVQCGDWCTSTTSDPANCGACNHACPNSNWSCVNSNCACQPPHQMCGTACVDTQVDMQNCGGCNIRCLGGTVCEDGQCIRRRTCSSTTCHAPYHCCDDGFGHLSCVGAHVECQ